MMSPLVFPAWSESEDPDVGRQLTEILSRLYGMFGDGTPVRDAEPTLPEFPFSVVSGHGSGIEAYRSVQQQFVAIKAEFDSAAEAFRAALEASAEAVEQGRAAINDAIDVFNARVAALVDGDWVGLLQAEVDAIETAADRVAAVAHSDPPLDDRILLPGYDSAAAREGQVPLPGYDIPAAPADNSSGPSTGVEDGVTESSRAAVVPSAGEPLVSSFLPALSAIPSMASAPFSGVTAPLNDVVSQLLPLAVEAVADAQGPDRGGQEGPGTDETGEAESSTAVQLPSGEVVEAGSATVADAVRFALTHSESGDAARDAYSAAGVELPAEYGTVIDRAEARIGDVVQFDDGQTRILAAPDRVADPSTPGTLLSLDEATAKYGEVTIYRPDLAVGSATVNEPAEGLAPPSPFETTLPPSLSTPSNRTTQAPPAAGTETVQDPVTFPSPTSTET